MYFWMSCGIRKVYDEAGDCNPGTVAAIYKGDIKVNIVQLKNMVLKFFGLDRIHFNLFKFLQCKNY